MNEHVQCCRVCRATVSTGRCIGGCPNFDYDKYDHYHERRETRRLELKKIELLEEIARGSRAADRSGK
jgi:hypothetical protein